MKAVVYQLPGLQDALAAADGLPGPNPFRVLGVPPTATADELREAYLARLKEHPRESDPEGFEVVKKSWMTLRSPLLKAVATIDWHEVPARLTELVREESAQRLFIGAGPWLALAMAVEESHEESE